MKILTSIIIATLFSSVSFTAESIDGNSINFDKKTIQAFNRTPQISKQKNGQISLDTNNSFKNVILSRMNKYGKLETYCTDNKENARKFLQGESLISIEGGANK